MRDHLYSTRTRPEIAAGNREELDAWIEERVAALIATGVPPDAARQRALEEFGDVGTAARYADRQDVRLERRIRATLWLEDLAADVRIARRMLVRTPMVTTVVLMTFALGIGAATAVFSVVHAMLLRPLPYGHEETLVQLQAVEQGALRPLARFSAAAVAALRERTSAFSAIAAIDTGNVVVKENDDPEQVNMSSFTLEAFDVLQARAAIGRTFGPEEMASVGSKRGIVLLDSYWRRRFGADPNIVGRTIDTNLGGGRLEVLGVMPPDFRVPTYEAAELLAPRDLSGLLANANSAQVRVFRLFARLKPGVVLGTAQRDVDRVMLTLQLEFPRSFSGLDARVVPIRTAVAGDARPRLLVLMGAATFVLVIGCANVAGILLSRAIARRQELALRVALGAGRRRLIRQFLAEAGVLAVLGAVLGLLFAELGIVALRQIAASALPAGTTFALEPRVLLFAIAAASVAAVASALFPTVRATHSLGHALRSAEGRATLSRANRRLRLGLVAGQLAVSAVLLVGAGLFLRTLHRLSTLDVGYSTEQVLTFRLPFKHQMSSAEQEAFWASMYEHMGAIPGVVSVASGNVPMSGQSTVAGLEIDGRSVENGRLPDVRYTFASEEYFATLGIPIVRGRTFTPEDREGAPPVAVVSADLARRFWPDQDAIGARVRPAPATRWFTIVGIAGDVRSGPADAPVPSLYTSHRQDRWPGGGAVVMRAAGDPEALLAGVRAAARRVDPALPIVGLQTLEDFRRHMPAIAERRMQMQLLLVFAIVALVVSAIGVYGVGAYATEARRREFGIRMALGASPQRVLWLALRDAATVAVVGALAGIPAALFLASRLPDRIVAVTPYDPPVVAAVAGLLMVVVFAASLVPARRATQISLAKTMKAE